VELWQCGSDGPVRMMAVVLVRNLCFYAPTKTLLASNGNAILYKIRVFEVLHVRKLLGSATSRIEFSKGEGYCNGFIRSVGSTKWMS